MKTSVDLGSKNGFRNQFGTFVNTVEAAVILLSLVSEFAAPLLRRTNRRFRKTA